MEPITMKYHVQFEKEQVAEKNESFPFSAPLPVFLFSLLIKAAKNAVIPTSLSKGPVQFILESTQRTVFLEPFTRIIMNL